MTATCASISDHPANHDTWQGLLQSKNFRQLFLVTFGALLLSKGGALLPGMAPDDYFFAIHGLPGSIIDNLVAVGRGLNALLVMALNAMGASVTNVSVFSFFVACMAIAFAIAVSVTLLKSTPNNHLHDYVACVFAATHPYLTSYFLFRMSLLNTAVAYAALALALLLLVYRRSHWQTAACALVIATFCHMSQIVLILFAIAAGGWSLARFCRERESGATLRNAASGIVTVISVLAVATLLYLASSAAIREVMHVSAVKEYTPHLTGGLEHAIGTVFNLAYQVLLTHEPIEPQWLKIWVLIAILPVFAICLVRKPLRCIAAIILLIGGILVSVSPLALSWGGLVPRTFSPAGLCLALVFSFACDSVSGSRVTHSASMLLTLPMLCFALIGASMFYQQLILTHWDQRTAAAILNRVDPEINDGAPIRIASSWPVHPQRLGYGGPGINESALLNAWSYRGLFEVATGENVNVVAAKPDACKGMPAWPSAASTRQLADGSVLVCVGRGNVEMVRRDFPTAPEEAALRLNYPLFYSYGPDTARVTPFFPGTSKQPVAVELAPNFSGYALRAEGGNCAFPLTYQLMTSDGKQLAAGAYKGTAPIHLAGWNAKAGDAILSLSMATGSKNNYGCNVVVTALHGTTN